MRRNFTPFTIRYMLNIGMKNVAGTSIGTHAPIMLARTSGEITAIMNMLPKLVRKVMRTFCGNTISHSIAVP